MNAADSMPRLMQNVQLGVPLIARRAQQLFGHKRIVTQHADGPRTATYLDVTLRASRIRGALDSLGLPPGSRVGTFLWNCVEHLELYLGVPSAGRVLHTLNHRLHTEQLIQIITDAADAALVVDAGLLDILRPTLERVNVPHIIVVSGNGDWPEGHLDYDEFLGRGNVTEFADVDDERAAAALCHTSGTTGQPKGVVYDHRSIVLHALSLLAVDTFGLSERDTVCPIVPMFHVNAWGLPYAAAMAGAELVLPRACTSGRELAAILADQEVTFAAGVTTVWSDIAPALPGSRLPALRRAVSGGGPLPQRLSRTFENSAGIPLTNAWGMTETSPVVCHTRISSAHDDLSDQVMRELNCVPGPPAMLTEVRIVRDGTIQSWDGLSSGELQVRGPYIAAGYLNRDEPATTDGWFSTGDVATIDHLGYVRIVDRIKDLIKSGGEWIPSAELEAAILRTPSVREAVVVGVPHVRWGERPVAVITIGDGADPDQVVAQVRTSLEHTVVKWWLPEHIAVVDSIPRTATGKFDKRTVRDTAAAGLL